MRVNQFDRRARRRALFMGAGATSLAVLLVGTARAQDSQPSIYSSAIRYDGAGRPVGEIGPDPDGAGPLRHPATRTSYNAVGQKVKVEKGELSAWQPTSVAPNAIGNVATVSMAWDSVFPGMHDWELVAVSPALATQMALGVGHYAGSGREGMNRRSALARRLRGMGMR